MSDLSAQQFSSWPVLSLLILLPLAAVVWIMKSALRDRIVPIAIGSAIAELLLTVYLLVGFDRQTPKLQFAEQYRLFWIWNYHLGVDGLSILFLPMTALLTLLLVLYVATYVEHGRKPLVLAALLGYEGVSLGIILSIDMLQFWLLSCAELLLALLLLRDRSDTHARSRAVLLYTQFMALALALSLSAFLVLAWHHAGVSAGHWSFDLLVWSKTLLPTARQTLVLFLLLFAVAIRLPAFPLHAWMPILAQRGPLAPLIVLLAGMKLGVYMILRIVLPLLPQAVQAWSSTIILLALAGMIYGAIMAFMQLNIFRLLAFAAVSQAGLLLVALFSRQAAGFDGALLLSLNFGLALAGLYIVTGFIWQRAATVLSPRLTGLFDNTPMLGLAFLVVALGCIAMPGTPGFEAAHLALEGVFEIGGWSTAVVAGMGSVLAAGYLFAVYQRVFLAQRLARGNSMIDLARTESIIVGILCAVMFAMGLYATPWLNMVVPSTRNLSHFYEQHSR